MCGAAPKAFSGTSASPTQAQWSLAHSLRRWRALHGLVAALMGACANLLEQLGALCAAQTRKATILQGKQRASALEEHEVPCMS